MSRPAVSILVVTYRHARFVDACLDSILAQTCTDFETVIVDDASDDGTPERITRWLLRNEFQANFIRNPTGRGLCANLNTALAAARGEFICFLSGDDALMPERIECQWAAFGKATDDTAVLYSDAALIGPDGLDLGMSFLQDKLGDDTRPSGDVFRRLLLEDNFLPVPAVMVRRAAIDSVGHYDESLCFEDLYMWLKLSHRFRFAFLPGCVAHYRVHENNMSRSASFRPAMIESSFRVLSAWSGKCGDAEPALSDRLWYLAMKQLLIGDPNAARRMMPVIAGTSVNMRRKVAARLTALPGGCSVVRLLSRAYAGVRGSATGPPSRGSRRASIDPNELEQA